MSTGVPPFLRDVIHCRDCSSMPELPDSSIDLVISGPPYWTYIDYGACAAGEEGVGTWADAVAYQAFLQQLRSWHGECHRVLKPGRYCIVNLGTVKREGRTVPLPFDAVAPIQETGLEFQCEIVWHKVTGGREDARVTVQHPYAGRYHPNIRTEYLLVFRKDPNVPFANPRCAGDTLPIDGVFKREIANNVWHIPPVRHDGRSGHPCPFPPEIPLRLIRLYSSRGETVLDPFMGVGTTARAAKATGRHFVGYEIVPEFVDRAQELLHEPLLVRKGLVCRYERADPGSPWT